MINLLLSTKIIDPNLGDDIGQPSIAYAGFSGQDDVVKKLLATPGVDPDLKDRDGRTPLSWTGNPDAKDYKGRIPLSYAVENGDLEIIKSVVAKSSAIDLSAVDAEGRTLLSYASERDLPEIKKSLLI